MNYLIITKDVYIVMKLLNSEIPAAQLLTYMGNKSK